MILTITSGEETHSNKNSPTKRLVWVHCVCMAPVNRPERLVILEYDDQKEEFAAWWNG